MNPMHDVTQPLPVEPKRRTPDALQEELERAARIQRSLGLKVAQAFLRRRGWSAESVVYWTLVRPTQRSAGK